MKKKAQSALEFMILVAAVIFSFLIFLFVIQLNISDKTIEKKNLIMKEIALTAQNEINLAIESSDGYYREFEIPQRILNSDYEIDILEGFVYIRTTDGKYAFGMPVPNVTGDFNVGTNVIRRENGVVYVNG